MILEEGVDKLKSHMYVGRYTLEMAIADAAKAAYLATVIQYVLNKIEKYSGNPSDVKGMTISPAISKDVAKIRRGNPEAFYYWCKISQILQAFTQTS